MYSKLSTYFTSFSSQELNYICHLLGDSLMVDCEAFLDGRLQLDCQAFLSWVLYQDPDFFLS